MAFCSATGGTGGGSSGTAGNGSGSGGQINRSGNIYGGVYGTGGVATTASAPGLAGYVYVINYQ